MSQSNPARSSRIYAFTPSHARQETSNFRGQIARLYEHRSDIAVRGPCLRAILLKRNCPGWQMSLKFLTARKVRGSDTPTHRIILIWDDLPQDDRELLASSL